MGVCQDILDYFKPVSSQSFSICHWNLSSMSAHNYSKISLLTDIYLYNILIYVFLKLTSTADINDGNLKIPGYIMYRVDHPYYVKRGGVCIYYKTMLLLKILSTNFL